MDVLGRDELALERLGLTARRRDVTSPCEGKDAAGVFRRSFDRDVPGDGRDPENFQSGDAEEGDEGEGIVDAWVAIEEDREGLFRVLPPECLGRGVLTPFFAARAVSRMSASRLTASFNSTSEWRASRTLSGPS